jgi:hypothetical protein
MGVFKEEASIFENVARKSTRIYSDAADYGFPYKRGREPQDIVELLESIESFKEIDRNSNSSRKFIRNRNVWGKGRTSGVSISIRIAWEIDEGFYCGTEYTISFNRISGKSMHPFFDSYISVDDKPYRER